GGTGADWNATFTSLSRIKTRSSFEGVLTVPVLPLLDVRGNMIHAGLNLTAPTTGNALDLGRLMVRGDIASSTIIAAGSLGPITARSMTSTLVYAGVSPLPSGEFLPTSAADFSAPATIRAIGLHPSGKNVVGF